MFLIGLISSKVNLLKLLLFELWIQIISFGFMIYYIEEMEGNMFGLFFVINYMALGPMYAASNSLIYRSVKPESASLMININFTASIVISSFISYANGLIQDS
jgi:hypothetical protein